MDPNLTSPASADRPVIDARKLIALAVFIAAFAFVFYVTFRASPKMVEVPWLPTGLGLWLDRHDEFRHFIGFAFLASLAFWLNFDFLFQRARSLRIRRLRASRYRTGRLGAFLVLIYLLELAQLVLPRRSFDWLDILNGWAGVLFAWSLWLLWKVRQRRQRRALARRRASSNIAPVQFK